MYENLLHSQSEKSEESKGHCWGIRAPIVLPIAWHDFIKVLQAYMSGVLEFKRLHPQRNSKNNLNAETYYKRLR